MFMIRKIRRIRLKPSIEKRKLIYSKNYDTEESLRIQLDLFNKEWIRIRHDVPFYRDLYLEKNLPDAFRSWHEIISSFPVIDRKTIQANCDNLMNHTKRADWYRITGGSTAEPIQIPSWHSENKFTSPDMWLARSWYGIQPSDRLFLIWGHSHLLGRGLAGLYKRLIRQIKDHLLGYYRFSAYNINRTSMRKAGEGLIRYRPQYIIGYSNALDAFARANEDRANQLSSLKLKAVIGAAEGFPATDSKECIEKVFGAPVAMEYGAVETGLMAHTHPNGGYTAFWRTYFIEAAENGSSEGRKVRITSLFPRCFPLIRYEIGDEIELQAGLAALGVRQFQRVMGRSSDYLLLPDGSRIHATLINDVIRSYIEIKGFQSIQDSNEICLALVAKELTNETLRNIRYSMGIIHPYLANIKIETVENLEQSIAGKTPIVIKKGTINETD